MPASYLSPKTAVRPSPIEGNGLFARRAIRKGEIVAIKGGHVYDKRTLAKIRKRIAVAYVQIADGFYIGAMTAAEVARNKIFINHSCRPNVGIRGQIIFVALRPIRAGEELTYDWAMEEGAAARSTGEASQRLEEGAPARSTGEAHDPVRCRCRAPNCRRWLTGRDWKRRDLQRRYKGYFSSYLEDKIRGFR